MSFNVQHIAEQDQIEKLKDEIHSLRSELEFFKSKRIDHDLQKKNDELMQFSYVISHNVRSPVASIIGLVDLIKKTKKPEVVIRSTDMLLESALNLDTIIKDLNKILNSKRSTDEREIIYFDEVLSGISHMLFDSICENKVIFNTDFSVCKYVKSTKGHIQSIFYNLISNSIKYRRKNTPPIIEIKSSVEANQIVLVFSDNGLGIDLERFESKMFVLYQRFHLHTEGKGIGLYLVKSHVEALGGYIEVNSVLNEGTSFIIKFPIN